MLQLQVAVRHGLFVAAGLPECLERRRSQLVAVLVFIDFLSLGLRVDTPDLFRLCKPYLEGLFGRHLDVVEVLFVVAGLRAV